jgi:FtsP/CotA-like multicopper oxidase with cupredoxin domain
VVELGRVPSPFGVAVTPEGRQRYELTAWLQGLPDAGAFGATATYVAWATTPVLEPVIRLGEVRDGENALGTIALDRFLVLISAEPVPDGDTRLGPLVLRGRSPSTLLEGHDLLAQAPSAVQPGDSDAHAHGADGHGGGWAMPPGYPGIAMLPGMARIAPRVSPLVPAPPDPAAVPDARPGGVVELPDGGTLDLEAGWVRRRIAGREVFMLGFNGQHPGPLLRVRQRATVFVDFTNRTPFPTAVHWHGVRLDNRFDGVPGVTQEPVEPGGRFRYRIVFPDAGLYWYHPHHREDVQQELGLYGNLRVDPLEPDHYGPVHREEVLMLDDLLLDSAGLVPFGAESANHMLMGRFGNVPLVNGEPSWELEVDRGAVVRFLLTNASNTRTFNLSFVPAGPDGAPLMAPDGRSEGTLPLKVIASDVGRFEREERAESAVLGPAERYVVEARFPESGDYVLVNRVRAIDHRRGLFLDETTTLATVHVGERAATPDLTRSFEALREHADVVAEMERYRALAERPPDRELILALEVDDLPVPMEQAMLYDRVWVSPVEWAGTMPHMNWASSGREVRWILRDPHTGRENLDIDWRFRVGDVVKVRVTNDRNGFHSMQHPLHVHGQRFLVLEQDGVSNPNLVWKDTVLLPAGSTTDLLLELSNPGRWMVHCHIAEHLESGMKLVMEVDAR